MPDKVKLFTIISKVRIAERVPRVTGVHNFALAYQIDPAVNWGVVLAGVDPRATLISEYKTGAKAGMIYPTDLALPASVAEFIGVLIDGADYENDPNITVSLEGALDLRWIQSLPSKPWGVIDPIVVAQIAALKMTRVKNLVFWNSTAFNA